MGRGKSFNHKIKGHDHELPKRGKQVPPKHTENVEYAIEPVASYGDRAVTIEVKKDTD
ncbi:hypothetical protein ACFSCX_18445 [Bacillus salitolerans]|uniref:Uncharacterized protein n=1 Tax=Bacillus salitolerans TaxID=1437434 RepID=A0ABW4LWG8_9BACI